MNRKRSGVASRVLAVLSSGWQLTSANGTRAASTTTVTRFSVSLISANGVTEPGATPSSLASSSAFPASTKVLILGIFVEASDQRRSYGHQWDDQLQRPVCLQAGTGWVWQERKCGPDRGCSSGVEHNLAKVGVVGSNPIARSNFSQTTSTT